MENLKIFDKEKLLEKANDISRPYGIKVTDFYESSDGSIDLVGEIKPFFWQVFLDRYPQYSDEPEEDGLEVTFDASLKCTEAAFTMISFDFEIDYEEDDLDEDRTCELEEKKEEFEKVCECRARDMDESGIELYQKMWNGLERVLPSTYPKEWDEKE